MSGRRTFELTSGTSRTFWEVWLEGTQVFTRSGRVGSKGPTTVREERSEAAAQKLHDKLIREKTAKGFEERAPGAAPAPAQPAISAAPAPLAPVVMPPPDDDDEDDEDDEAADELARVEPGFRRFHFSQGTSNKFWEVRVEETEQTVRFGRIGAAGQEKVKDFASAEEARAATRRLIAEKVGKGYVEVGRTPRAPAGSAELEAAIEQHLDDPRGYLVYADWLQAKGEPLGELIVLQHRAAAEPSRSREVLRAASALLSKHAKHFFGTLADIYRAEPFEDFATSGLRVQWQFGFMRAVKIGWGNFDFEDGDRVVADDLTTLLELPVARFLQCLEIGPIPSDERMSLQEAVDVLEAVRKPTTLRELRLGNIGDWDISSTETGLFEPLAAVYPGLRKLTLHGGEIGLGSALVMPELRELAIETGSLTETEIEQICELQAPKLERLEIWFGNPNYGASGGVGDIAPILAARSFPKLTHLGLMNCPFADDIARALPGSKVLRQLTSLDLSMGCLSDAGLDAMVLAWRAFAHLEHLNLNDNALTEASRKKVRGLAKSVNFGEHDPDRAGDDAYRYVTVGE